MEVLVSWFLIPKGPLKTTCELLNPERVNLPFPENQYKRYEN